MPGSVENQGSGLASVSTFKPSSCGPKSLLVSGSTAAEFSRRLDPSLQRGFSPRTPFSCRVVMRLIFSSSGRWGGGGSWHVGVF